MKLLPLILLLILTGCETAPPDFHDAAATVAQGRPWLQPVAQENQSIATKEGRIYIRADDASTSVDLECGIYLDEHDTCVVYKIVNDRLFRSIVAFPKFSVKDARGNEMPVSSSNQRQELGFERAGIRARDAGPNEHYWEIPPSSGIMGNEAFTGLPSEYPVTVSWQYTEGKVVTFIFDAPKQ
jgi:hypothetical protein